MKMINNKIKNIGLATLLIVSAFSCKTNLDINVDPNNPTLTTAQPSLILPAALQNTANFYNRSATGNNNFAYASIWLGHSSFSGNFFISQEAMNYTLTTNFGEGSWTIANDNNTDYDLIQKLGAARANPMYEGIGKIMKAYNYQTLVDLYDNIPYSEAQQGAVNPTPKYDNGKAVYEALMTEIESATTLIKNSVAGSVGTDDIMFHGDKDLWVRFANTVKLRMLLRQSEKADRQAYITAKLATISGGFLTTNAAINPGYLNSDGKQNGLWRSFHTATGTYNADFYRAGGYTVNFMKNNNDPRISRMYKPNGSGNYVGGFLGAPGIPNGGQTGTSEFGPGLLKGPTQDAILMTAAESYFLQSEAALRNWSIGGGAVGDAKALFQSGVNASFAYLGATGATTYMAQLGNKQVNWDATSSTAEKLALIIRQKFLALSMINVQETYNDYRRLGLPADVPLSQQAGSNRIPNRLLYPQREYDVNGANVSAQPAVTATSKIWWMP
jgi:Starch-binding associating with outer membrane